MSEIQVFVAYLQAMRSTCPSTSKGCDSASTTLAAGGSMAAWPAAGCRRLPARAT